LFILLELPKDEIDRQTKLDKSLDVEDAIKYLKTIFWVYANNNKYNYTADQGPMLYNFLRMQFINNLVFVTGRPFHPNLMFASIPRV
jgi:hypothetical protein